MMKERTVFLDFQTSSGMLVLIWSGYSSMITSWHSPKTEIRSDSNIEGSGLFAKESISKGEVIAVKGGHLANKAVLDKVEQKIVRGVSLKITDDLYIAPLTQQEREATMVYFNHSCDANVGFGGNIVTIAIRDIKPGEELTVEYAMFESNPDHSMACNCQRSICRGTLSGTDWKSLDLQKRYKGYFSWFIQQKIDCIDSRGIPSNR